MFAVRGPLLLRLQSQDDNFDTDKTRGFIGNAVSGVLPGVLTGLNRFGSPGAEFESVEELLGLYDENDLARDGLSASELQLLRRASCLGQWVTKTDNPFRVVNSCARSGLNKMWFAALVVPFLADYAAASHGASLT